ncbi:hypothetical protein BHE74_00057516 [Ensete ventricosum]|nr:hypothetical protein BHE74_00057516 [Ensete ventricosum]
MNSGLKACPLNRTARTGLTSKPDQIVSVRCERFLLPQKETLNVLRGEAHILSHGVLATSTNTWLALNGFDEGAPMISKQNRRRFAVRSEGRVQLPPSQKVIGRKSGNPSSDVEGTTMPNGSGLSPEGKTSVVVDSEKKEYAGKSIEVEEATIMNGSGPPTEDKSVVPNSGKNGNEGESIEEEKHVEEMMHSDEKKHGEENGIAKEVDIKTADVNTIKADDVKMVDAEAENAMEVENVKMVDGADFKDEKEGEGREEEGGEKEAKEEEEGGEGEEEEGGEEEAKEDEGKEDGDEEGGEQEAKEEKVGKEGEEGEGSKEEENNMEEGDIGSTEKEIDEDKEEEKLNKKRSRGQKADKKGEGKEGVTKARNSLSSPVTSSIERPVRERKTVERLVEIIEKEPSREFQVEKVLYSSFGYFAHFLWFI